MLTSLAERLDSLSEPEPNSGCWLWVGCVDKRGYGKTSMGKGRTVIASRLSYHAFVCDPGELSVLHKCDQPSCVIPDHLWLGTQKQNIRDCVDKRRLRPRGRELRA